MPIRVQAGNQIVEFPDGTPEDVMRKALVTLAPTAPGASAYEMLTRTGKMAPPTDEQSPLIKGLMSMGSGMAHPGIDTQTGERKPLINTIGDVTSLLLPSALGSSAAEAASRYYQGTKAAVRETKSVRDAATLPVRAYQKVKDALPSVNDAEVEKFLNRGAKVAKAEPTITSGVQDIVDRNLPAVKRAPVPTPPVAKAPSLDEALQSALEESMRSNDPARASTLAADTNVAGAAKPKLGKRPGGYTTDLPPITETRQKELLQKFGGLEPVPTEVGSRPVEPVSTGSASPVDASTGGAAEAAPNTKLKLTANEVAELGRRMKGSRDASAMLYGPVQPEADAGSVVSSAAERAAAIKRLAPGPSRIPLDAEARINGQPRDLSLEEALAELIQNRTKGAE